MKESYVENISEREWVDSVFLVRDKITATAKNGKPYLTLKLMDRTGEVEGRVWDNVESISAGFERDDFVRVTGRASLYLGKMQLVIQTLVRVDDEGVDLGDFLPVAARSVDVMLEELKGRVSGLNNVFLKRLMGAFLADQEFIEGFCSAPAAKSMHHVYLGGLLEHSLAVARLAEDLCRHYPLVDRDLLVVGALLHDIGKVAELRYSRSFEYTDAGKLLGHIVMGVELVEEKVRMIDGFPPMLATLLKHLLLSHHGQYEFGSPKRPKILEAVILNFIDDLDSKINGITSYLHKERIEDGQWTGYHRFYDRYFYRPVIEGEGQEPPPLPARELAAATGDVPAERHAARLKGDRPLRHSLAEQFKGKSLELFAPLSDDEETP